MKYEFHEAANIFPLDDEHIEELAKDIKEQGQLQPIEIFCDKILDGRRRWTLSNPLDETLDDRPEVRHGVGGVSADVAVCA